VVERGLAVLVMLSVRLLYFPFVAFSLTYTQDWTIKTWNYGMNMKEEQSMASSH
jgi:hypothetical protein